MTSNTSKISDRLPGDKKPEEIALEKSGNVYALQKHRYILWFLTAEKIDGGTNLNGLLCTEVALRENTQRETALREKIRGLLTRTTTDDSATLVQELQEEISKLNKEYWKLERRWWQIRASFKDTSLTRGIELWRSHPKWYMHRVLREDCVGRGGCCGRGCGCCSNRQNIPERKFAAGHCTVECACCEQARGFELDSDQKAQIQEAFKLDRAGPGAWYYNRIKLAALLGLMVGNCDNPFDLLDEPPPTYLPPSVPS